MQILHILRLELYLLTVRVVHRTFLINRNNLLYTDTIHPTSPIGLFEN